MPTYLVFVPERHIARYVITAKNPAEARKKAKKGAYDDVSDLEFVETLGDSSEWEVEPAEDEEEE